ncbi:MAG: hypothetical protein JSW64_05990 [Candidatus Zixiibacteriota bacterium]|nr:MAG: hypothetical protein JSW64_05990 [candidate division Zixibacteria bacterium]
MKFNSAIVRFIIISLITLTGALWLFIKGPVAVIRGTTALDEIVPFWYMVTAFPVLGMLLANLLSAFRKHGLGRPTILLFLQIFILVVISNVRLSLQIPISGHAFMFAFFIFYRIFGREFKEPFQKAEFAVVIILLLTVGYIKLGWWNDPITLSIGIITGFALATTTLIINLNRNKRNSTA